MKFDVKGWRGRLRGCNLNLKGWRLRGCSLSLKEWRWRLRGGGGAGGG